MYSPAYPLLSIFGTVFVDRDSLMLTDKDIREQLNVIASESDFNGRSALLSGLNALRCPSVWKNLSRSRGPVVQDGEAPEMIQTFLSRSNLKNFDPMCNSRFLNRVF